MRARFLGRLGGLWGRLGSVLGASWGRSGGVLARPGGVLARPGGVLGASWRHPVADVMDFLQIFDACHKEDALRIDFG